VLPATTAELVATLRVSKGGCLVIDVLALPTTRLKRRRGARWRRSGRARGLGPRASLLSATSWAS